MRRMTDDGERGLDGSHGSHDEAIGGAPHGESAELQTHSTSDAHVRGNVHHLPLGTSRAGPMTAADLQGLPSGDISKSGFSVLARLCGALRAFDPESTGMRIPLAELEDDDMRKIDALLGRDGVQIDSTGDPIRKGYATRIAGVWRAHIETPEGDSLFEWLEIGDVPSFVRDLATMGAAGRPGSVTPLRPNGGAPENRKAGNGAAINGANGDLAAAGVSKFMDKLLSAAKLFRHGQHNTSVPLDGLGHAIGSADAACAATDLRIRLGEGAVQMTSQSRAIRVHSTKHTNVWVIEYLPNGRPPEAKGMFQIEIGDVPAAMRAMPKDIEDSAFRFATVLERIVLGAPLSSVKI
jgi:hypothetical protein